MNEAVRNLQYFELGYALIWAIVFAYVFLLARKLDRLEKESENRERRP